MISFDKPVSTYTPEAFPIADEKRFIAPYWADVDTRSVGQVRYREERDKELLQRAKEDIKWAFPKANFTPTWLFIATWKDVGYYNCKNDKVSEH